MSIEEVKKVVKDAPYMSFEQASNIGKFIHDYDIKDVLELGFRHGVSTCYMADCLRDLASEGSIVTIDLKSAEKIKPDIQYLLGQLGLRDLVDIYYENTSYNWRLMKMIEEDSTPRFDMCYLDGAHNWYTDGFAFFLVDRLLRPGGWIIFDDVDWTYSSSPALREAEFVSKMPIEEQTTPQVRKVFELLVMNQPGYGSFSIQGQWAYAQKLYNSEHK